MTPDQLATNIESAIRQAGRNATRVVERRVADAEGRSIRLALTAPLVAWRMFTTLSADQRVMWVIWAWVLVGARLAVSRFRS